MNILVLTPGFASDENDHNCIPPLQLWVRAMGEMGVNINIIALEYPFRSTPYQWHNATVYPCNGQNRKWLSLRTLLRATTHGRRLIEQLPIDAIQSFWLTGATSVGIRLSEQTGVPHAITFMGQDVLRGNYRLRRLAKNPNLWTNLVVLSEFHQQHLLASSGITAKNIIPWGVENIKPFPTNTTRNIDIIGVGSMLPVKNWSRWLRLVHAFSQIRPNLNCQLIGDGPLLATLQKEAKALGLDQIVTFTGNLPRPEVLERMRDSKILLHTSNFESFGFIFPEALESGCQLVSTPVGIAPEISQNTHIGHDDMCLAINTFYILDGYIRGKLKFGPFKHPYNIENCAAQYLELYQQMKIN